MPLAFWCLVLVKFHLGLFAPDEVVDVQVVLAWHVPRIVRPHRVLDEMTEMIRIFIVAADRPRKRAFDASMVVIFEDVTVPLAEFFVTEVLVKDCIREPADRSDNGNSSVAHRDQLCESARLEAAWDEHHVCAGIDLVSQFLVKTNLEVAIGVVVDFVFEVPEIGVDRRSGLMPRRTNCAVIDAVKRGEPVQDLLGSSRLMWAMIGFSLSAKRKRSRSALFSWPLSIRRCRRCEVGRRFQVPCVVVDAIEDAAKFSRVLKRPFQAKTLALVANFACMRRRNSCDKVRIDNAALH